MAYTINLTNGTTLIPGGLSDGTVDVSKTSLTLIGKDYAGYGQFLNENFVYLLENFANTSSPANPLRGQLWWDTTNNILKVYSGTSWKISTGATSSPFSSPPGDLSALGGDLWWDTTNAQLKVYSGAGWVTVGPAATSILQTTGSFAATIVDTAGGSHKVIQLQFNGIVYALFAYETFSTTIPGFTTIRAGINFSTTASPQWKLSNQDVNATPSTIVERDTAGGITAGAINATAITATTISASSTINGTFSGSLTGNVAATTVSASTVAAQGITATSGFSGPVLTASQPAITSLGTLTGLAVNGTTTLTGLATLNGVGIATLGGSASFSSVNGTPVGNATPSTGAFTTLNVQNSLTPSSNLVVNLGGTSNYWNNLYAGAGLFAGAVSTPVVNAGTLNVNSINATGAINISNLNLTNLSSSLIPSANVTYNIGSPTAWFGTIYGTTIRALYADLAERFHSDAEYPAGTVVEMGGVNEVTKVVEDLSEKVFGVISTNAAYLMNSTAGDDITHPPIAMSGRVPVRVIGLIAKGDRLVSAGNGLARRGARNELTPFNVIGRALENKTDDAEGIIEAIVKLNS
jgi:hypothetical protein